jgi:excisionase family DNA binding protein
VTKDTQADTPETPEVQYLTVAEVARDLRIGAMTVYRMIHKGEIEAIQIHSRCFRIPVKSYTAYKRQLHADAQARVKQLETPIPGQTEVAL